MKNKGINKAIALIICSATVFSLAACQKTNEVDPNPTPTPEPEPTPTPTVTYPLSAEETREQFWTVGDDAENEKFEEITNGFFRDVYKNDMLNLHYTVKNLEDYGFERVKLDLNATTDADFDAVVTELKTLDYDLLSRDNKIVYDMFMEEDKDDEVRQTLTYQTSSFSYSSGIQSNFITIAIEYVFQVEQDICDYLDMLEQFPEYIETCIDGEEERIEAGYGYPDFILDEIISQCDEVINEEPSSCIYVVNENIDAVDFLSDSEKAEYKVKNEKYVNDYVIPTYQRMKEALTGFKGKSSNQDGAICSYEGGEEYYKMMIKDYAGYDGTAQELADKLSNYISDIYSTLSSLVNQSNDNYNQYLAWIEGDDSDYGTPDEILSDILTKYTEKFPAVEDPQYNIQYLPESYGKANPSILAYYVTPQIDNYIQGSIKINGYSDSEGSDLYNTVLHEGYPGHMYQSVYFLSNRATPVRECFSYSGYSEGWAVYAANQAWELYDGYTGDKSIYDELNAINVSLNYALNAYLDVGVNGLGWSGRRVATMYYMALGYSLSEISSMLTDEDIESFKEYRNVFVEMPGVYLSYGAGNMFFEEARSYAEKAAGDSFDEIEFHQLVLDIGPMSFTSLNKLEEEYYDIKMGKNS